MGPGQRHRTPGRRLQARTTVWPTSGTSEDGVTEARERSTEQPRAWQDAAVVRESVTEATLNLFGKLATRC